MDIYQCNREKKIYGHDTVSLKLLEKALIAGQLGTPESECWVDLLLANDFRKVLIFWPQSVTS